jgi:hypothetical protein
MALRQQLVVLDMVATPLHEGSSIGGLHVYSQGNQNSHYLHGLKTVDLSGSVFFYKRVSK